MPSRCASARHTSANSRGSRVPERAVHEEDRTSVDAEVARIGEHLGERPDVRQVVFT